ncbi:hypothetical protein DITRI_Ditri15bG0033300 [Diplodiscus trichospermus]
MFDDQQWYRRRHRWCSLLGHPIPGMWPHSSSYGLNSSASSSWGNDGDYLGHTQKPLPCEPSSISAFFQGSNPSSSLPFSPFHPLWSGVENLQDVPVSFVLEFITVLSELYDPLVKWFQSHPSPPIAILSDIMLASWTTKLGSQLNIPNFSFMVFSASAIVSRLNELENFHPLIVETFHGCLQSRDDFQLVP